MAGRISSWSQYLRRQYPWFFAESSELTRPAVWLSKRESVLWPSQGKQQIMSGQTKADKNSNNPETSTTARKAVPKQQKGGDHVVSHKHRISIRQYPKDCPPIRPCWFHAVDIPKRRPHPAYGEKREEKPTGQPKKYAAFSLNDSKAIEAAFQKLMLQEDDGERNKLELQQESGSGDLGEDGADRARSGTNTSLEEHHETIKVPVNEDYLFDVDVGRRELAPAYWLGPVYDVRRGTWFYQEGSTQRPCDENLAAQLEEGYLKTKAWKLASTSPTTQKPRSASQPRARPMSWAPGQISDGKDKASASSQITPQPSSGDLRGQAAVERSGREPPADVGHGEVSQNTYRLFGAHMGSVVTYQDATTAWLLTDDFLSRMNATVYSRFAGGGHFAGMKMTRGYVNPDKKVAEKDAKAAKADGVKGKEDADGTNAEGATAEEALARQQSPSETRRQTLARQMSSLLESPAQQEDLERQDEEVRRRDEREIEDDYRETEGEEQGREIEHLILVTHGIGQRLGLRLESVNFVHDVNTLRKTLKAVYADSKDLRALNADLDAAESMNSRIQVLPICWRHLLDFPKQSLKHNRKEHDLADTDVDDEEFPSLDDITVEGVPAVRNLITDLALDILLYQSPAYKNHISKIVLSECNRIYKLFMERNPTFNGKVSMIGHSLGSAIMFDILCRQCQNIHPSKMHKRHTDDDLTLDFDVEDFYALGSPIGLFQMLKGRTISAHPGSAASTRHTTSMDDPMLDGASSRKHASAAADAMMPDGIQTSRPKCSQIFNLFHPTDPISYRIEPLISPAMASLKPQPLPYTKRGIFGAPMGQGLTGIGARVSQSMSSMWSSMASSLLTRGLGYTGNEPTGEVGGAKSKGPLSMSQGAGTNVTGGVIPTAPLPPEGTEIAKASPSDAAGSGQHPPTLIDGEIETLYAGYQKRRQSVQSDAELRDLRAGSDEWRESEERARKLRREEDKVRRLNANGRVDYAIQEGVFDINLIAAIASHLSYWSDEDVR